MFHLRQLLCSKIIFCNEEFARCIASNVSKFVFISTDKAVRPTSLMGASKRFCEMMVNAYTRSKKINCASVRFGNVIGSSGSVLPLFKEQILNGGPVTITDKSVERFFMSISEASELVLQAGAMAKDENIFFLDMGKPVKIIDIAKKMIKFYSDLYTNKIHIKEIGLRDGEKISEELFISKKHYKTQHERISIWYINK